ncbi:sporulation integral membrane protein YtvI [Paenibacillus radicis (ex Gao et al. 2016)]|uniref:Sporulation integral membrane protein YtvI n=1 Tax=Paenibacillus radicis (ex Gao et al. 2016) TaxID=1737354 RepID=A0A917HDB9_9BACL|nr:sporulation integral membrane protein YtvI [Paenibacillus radicis (ex Gao et al. 2016)]GGG74891.1 sporulation integral membrane protein YtvI [Paenibacillus radicis (ex Gao et al. 2016)]
MSIKALVMLAVGLLLLYLLFTVGAPFLLALVVAIFMEPLTKLFIRKFRMNRLIASTISSTLFTIILLGLMGLLGVKIVTELIAFAQRVPNYVGDANSYVTQLMDEAETLYNHLSPDAVAQVEKWLTGLGNTVTGMVKTLSSAVISFASGIPGMFIFFIVFLVAVYMFGYSLNTMKASVLSLFEEKSRSQVNQVLDNLKGSIFGFLRSQIILSALTYAISIVGLLILDIKYPLAIALLIVVVDIMPILGTGSVLVPWGTYLLLTGDVPTGIGLYVLFLFITVFRRIIEPKILGDAVGIGSLAALISLYVGFKLVGVIGVFLGPLVIIIYMAARKAGLFKISIKL